MYDNVCTVTFVLLCFGMMINWIKSAHKLCEGAKKSKSSNLRLLLLNVSSFISFYSGLSHF